MSVELTDDGMDVLVSPAFELLNWQDQAAILLAATEGPFKSVDAAAKRAAELFDPMTPEQFEVWKTEAQLKLGLQKRH